MIEQASMDNIDISALLGREVRKVSPKKTSPKGSVASGTTFKNLKLKAKGKAKAANAAADKQAAESRQDPHSPFAGFVYTNPELPERDAQVLREIAMHRQAVRTQIELKRNSCHRQAHSQKKVNELAKSSTEVKSLKAQVLQQQHQNSAQKTQANQGSGQKAKVDLTSTMRPAHGKQTPIIKSRIQNANTGSFGTLVGPKTGKAGGA